MGTPNASALAPPSPVEGIDVSGYQPMINWSVVAASGKAFVYVKASERMTASPLFPEQWAGARDAGLLRGAYHFLRANANGAMQARFFLALLRDDPGELPPWLDVESMDGQTSAGVLSIVQMFLETVAPTLGRICVYVSPAFWSALRMKDITRADAIAAGADLAVAAYGFVAAPSVIGFAPPKFWQRSGTSTVTGIPGKDDADRWLGGSLDDLRAYGLTWRGSTRL